MLFPTCFDSVAIILRQLSGASLALLLWCAIQPVQRVQAADDGASSQPCVLLRNGNVLFGKARRIGVNVQIEREDSTTILLPETQVAMFADSPRELYQLRRRERRAGDLQRLQSDVRWCLRYGLIREAAEDVLVARELDPRNRETVQLLRQVAARLAATSDHEDSEAATSSHHQSKAQNSFVLPASHETTVDLPRSHPELGGDAPSPIDDQSLFLFARWIQPILTNRCASCHSAQANHSETSAKQAFQLQSAKKLQWAPKRSTNENLVNVLKYVDSGDPSRSLLRVKALDEHGGKRRSFGPESSVMTRRLDQWLAGIRFLSDDQLDSGDALMPVPPPRLASLAEKGEERDDEFPERLPRTDEPAVSNGADSGKVRRMPKVKNPFDPSIFNRQFHSE